jgi:murein DD-endopeptidase MepM/ murein hydrolase activator NlpD
MSRHGTPRRAAWSATLALLLVGAGPAAPFAATPSAFAAVPSAFAAAPSGFAAAPDLTARDWRWPTVAVRVVRPYVAPAHAYGPGHRGIDLWAPPGTTVRSPAPGTIAFAGDVAGRGVLTIDHGDGLVTTLEPVESALTAGTVVARGDPVATVAAGGHTAPGAVHFGVRYEGAYINPMLLLGGIPRAVLLPCC